MKKILLVPPQALPIPAVKGGAVEILVEILIEENEKYKKAKFILFSTYDEQAEKISKKYKYTDVIYTNKPSFISRKIYGLIVNKIFRNIFKLAIAPRRINDYKLINLVNKTECDYIVSQSLFTDLFKYTKNIVSKENMFFHSHSNMLPTTIEDDTYGNLISVSGYIKDCWVEESENKELDTFVVHNCVREELFSNQITVEEKNNLRRKLGFNKDDFVIIFCGRVVEEKGVLELLKAVQKISN